MRFRTRRSSFRRSVGRRGVPRRRGFSAPRRRRSVGRRSRRVMVIGQRF